MAEFGGDEPTDSQILDALVHGFKGAFAGAAILVAVGGLLFFALLRKRHVESVMVTESGGPPPMM